MDYCDKITKIIKHSNLDDNTATILSNRMVDANNAIISDADNDLPVTEDINREHKVGNKVLDFVQLAVTGQHMDNITVDEVKVILNAIKSIDSNDFYFANNFKLSHNNTFFDLFYNWCDDFVKLNAKANGFKSLSKIDLIVLLTRAILIGVNNGKLRKCCGRGNFIYYKYMSKYFNRFDNLFITYLQELHLIDKNKHFSDKKINLLDDKTLIYNYCKYHCVSAQKPSKFAKVIQNDFKAFKCARKAQKGEYAEFTKNMIGTYFGYQALSRQSFNAINQFKKHNKQYGINIPFIVGLLINLNLFADYVSQRAFRPNKIADKAINKITTYIPYDDKVWNSISKINAIVDKEDKDSKQKKGDNKNA